MSATVSQEFLGNFGNFKSWNKTIDQSNKCVDEPREDLALNALPLSKTNVKINVNGRAVLVIICGKWLGLGLWFQNGTKDSATIFVI